MPYQPYTTQLNILGTYTITAAMGISNLSLIGKSATVSQIFANNPIPGLPVPVAIDLGDGQIVNLIGANGGPVENVSIIVPAGGIVNVIANRN